MEKREIKFRAWDSGNKCMIRFDGLWVCEEYRSICFSAVRDDLTEVGKDLPGAYGTGSDPEADDAYILMQFTGLHDENGKEIFEGDYVNTVHGTLAVEWNDDTCKYQFSNGMDINDGEMYGMSKFVVGNIYETNLIA